jgi:rubrerythrin
MFPFLLEQVDVDGAVQEGAAEARLHTRESFLRRGAVAGGAALGAGALLSFPGSALARSKQLDLRILNFALTLEYLEAAFYADAVAKGALKGPARAFAQLVGAHEQTHVDTLRGALSKAGAKPVAKPSFDFGPATGDQAKFLATSFALENEGVRAYLGQAGRIKNPTYLGVAATIATVEARHAATVASLINDTPYAGSNSITPFGALDRATNRSSVERTVAKTGFIKN